MQGCTVKRRMLMRKDAFTRTINCNNARHRPARMHFSEMFACMPGYQRFPRKPSMRCQSTPIDCEYFFFCSVLFFLLPFYFCFPFFLLFFLFPLHHVHFAAFHETSPTRLWEWSEINVAREYSSFYP